VATLYDVLEVSPDVTSAELRRAYHRAARLLHPDLNPQADTLEAMRRLNDAWAVLSDPDRRRRYDLQIARSAPPAAVPAASPASQEDRRDDPESLVLVVPDHPLARLLRPSVIVIAVLAIIFIVTAYASPHGRSGQPNPTVPTASFAPPQTVPADTSTGQSGSGTASDTTGVVGRCIEPLMGYDAVVPCGGAGTELVLAAVNSGSDCPPGSMAYKLEGRPQIVCVEPAGR
jgi:hypothetical protein